MFYLVEREESGSDTSTISGDLELFEPEGGDVLGQDWRAAYERCPAWGPVWSDIRDELEPGRRVSVC